MARRAYSSRSYSNQTFPKQIVVVASNGTGSDKAFQNPLKTGHVYDSVRSALEAKKGEDWHGNIGRANEKPQPFSGKLKAWSSQGGFLRGISEYNRVFPYPVIADEPKEYFVEKAALLAVDSVSDCHEDRAVEERSHLKNKSDIADSSEDAILDRTVSSKEGDHREYEDPEFEGVMSILDRMISYTRSCIFMKFTAPLPTESQVGNITFDKREAELRDEALVKGSTNPPWPPGIIERCKRIAVESIQVSSSIRKVEDIESSIPEDIQSTGGDTESSEQSRFWSASEIELIPLDDDTVVGDFASVIADQTKAQGQEWERESRPKKWPWTCLSPCISREHGVNRRTNLYHHWRCLIGGSARYTIAKDYENDSEKTHFSSITRKHRRPNFYRNLRSRIGGLARYTIGKGYETDGDETHGPSISREHELHGRTNFYRHWRPKIGRSARYTITRGYETDGDEIDFTRYRTVSPRQSLARFVTLGKFLVDDDELSEDLSVDLNVDES